MSECFQCTKISQDIISDVALSSAEKDFNQLMTILPQGVYTTFRTYKHDHVIHLREQFERLEESAAINGITVKINRELVREVMRRMVEVRPEEEIRLRIWLDLSANVGDIYVISEQLQRPSAQEYAEGVRVATIQAERDNPKSKSSSFLSKAESLRKLSSGHVHETIMVSPEGTLLEGLSSNFFAIMDGIVWTEYEHVLDGITRRDALHVISKLGLSIQPIGINLEMVPKIQEAFISSASRGILPVVKINSIQVGDGKVGNIVKAITAEYEKLIDSLVKPI